MRVLPPRRMPIGRSLSVMDGQDYEALISLLGTHAPNAKKILDVTFNTGKMWKGTGIVPVRMDIDDQYDLDKVGSYESIPFGDSTFDVIVFDPPHLPNAAASDNSSGIFQEVYGIKGTHRDGDKISGCFAPFLKEAKRVLVYNGIVLAKIADLTHNHRYQWQHIDFIAAIWSVGMTPCDLLIKCDPKAGRLMSSKWKSVKHLRKAHCFWIVARNSQKCERVTA